MKLIIAFSFYFLANSIVAQQCSTGQIAYYSSCLLFIKTPLEFNTANSICTGFSGSLVSIHNAIDNRNVTSYVQHYTNGAFWVGAKTISQDVTNPTNWYWTDGTKFNYQNYQSFQPISQGSTSCMQVLPGTGKWSTAACSGTVLPFICELPSLIAQTCPSHCPSGYTWFAETDFCYKNFVQQSNFNDARSVCQADGGELTSIHSQNENDFLVQLSKTGLIVSDDGWVDQVWIGFIFVNQKWQWTDGTNTTYVNWGDGEPNKMQTEWWAVLNADAHQGSNTEASKWNNVGQIDERAFVCKRAALH
ncbi:unnamed protein product [Caenorhabditis angaria]|uniref:C-type lectin domain-containing protein n=1 Tax=Caenorhabditis angaria TaxID=860376 RepID=A0A9P1J2X2_9PELO|nr:unnamed protein product [Caenorhabditis angaria]